MFEELKNKKILFITTKNLDYLRNTQEIRQLKEKTDFLSVIGTKDKSYPIRLLKVYSRILTMSCKKYDAVFVGFAPQLIVPVFKWKFKKSKLYIDFFISMYDTLAFDRKKFKPKSIFGKMLARIDRMTLKAADGIIADTQAHAQYFSEELGADSGKIQVMYLEADHSIYYPHKVEKPAEAEGKYTVLYFGSILPLQGVDIVLEAAEILKDREDICFYIIGPIGEKMVKPSGTNIHYIQWLNQDKLSDYIAFSDLCLAGHFNKEVNKAKRTIPGKAYIYQAMGKPMILGENPANHELYSEKDPGIIFVEMGSGRKLAEKILESAEK